MHYRLALIGFGGVARALVEILRNKGNELPQKDGLELSVVAVSDLRLGMAEDPDGLDLAALVELPNEPGALAAFSGGRAEPDNEAVIKRSTADIVVEATFTNPETGEPALSHCRWALESGKHLVTSNKGPVALAAAELTKKAETKGLAFSYEGTVMSGTPVIRTAEQCLAGCHIAGFRGILNGTANFVLGQVETGMSFDDAIALAQSRGYAEADPTADIGGSDVLMKVLILARALFDQAVEASAVPCQGITGLSEAEVRAAKAEGHRWKLLGQGSLAPDGHVALEVAPIMLPDSDPLASIEGPTNALTLDTDLLGPVTVSGPGAGRIETGFALLADILAIHAQSQPPRYRQ